MKMKNTLNKRIWMLMIAICLLVCSVPMVAFASEEIDVNADCNPTITYSYDGESLEGVNVRLYKMAQLSKRGKASLAGDFSGYKVSLAGGENQWGDVASTCAGYVIADEINSDILSTTNENGKASFNGLDTGMYLVVTEDTEIGGYDYHFDPYVITLPAENIEGELVYSPNLSAKTKGQRSISLLRTSEFEEEELLEEAEVPETAGIDALIEKTIVAHWNDSANAADRPDSLSAEIYKDGVLQDSVVLDKANNWTYKWKVENADEAVWTVVERNVPENYTISSTQQGETFTLTNNHEAIEALTGTEEVAVFETAIAEVSEVPAAGGTPKTSQLNWPVPVLAIAGLAFLIGKLARG